MSVADDNERIREQRRAAGASNGGLRLAEPEVARALRFQYRDGTIVDGLGPPYFEYAFDSALGSNLFYFGEFEADDIGFWTRLLQPLAHPCILDVGANLGVHAVSWALALPGAHVYAFEPSKASRAMLERNVARNGLSGRVTVLPLALADFDGSATFHHFEDNAYDSLHATGRAVEVASSEARVTTLDAFVREWAVPEVTFVKIDVEGAEHAVLLGGAETLARFAPLMMVEISVRNSERNPAQTIALCEAAGYETYLLVDGFGLRGARYDDVLENFAFVPAARPTAVPAYPGPPRLLELTLRRLRSIRAFEEELARLRDRLSAAERRLEAAAPRAGGPSAPGERP